MIRVAKHTVMGLVVAALAASVVGAFAVTHSPGASAAPNKSPFVGVWTALDTDGSNMKLWVRGGIRPSHVKITDDMASSCDPDGPATGMDKGTLTATGALHVDFRVRCHNDHSVIAVSRTFEYRALTDTLRDIQSGRIWTRS
jgi:hypothetical protein